ncbi:tetratricopeptide repeat protein [Pontixanthobacter sp.]|uniref:tetratricopeptide repeat protein n=1 Tax=Pontixanthobacter sp. TaxID=2792078 RepID=UPI003C7DA06F
MSNSLRRIVISGLAIFAVAGTGIPALAQSTGEEARLRKLESEVRALQRQVFPGGDGRYFEPQISSAPAANGANTAPSTTAVTDILIRLDAMEAQIASLTAQTEVNSNALVQITNRLVALETTPGSAASGSNAAASSSAPANILANTAAGSGNSSTVTPVTSATPVPAQTATAASGPSAARLAAVQQIAKPQTDDAADDEYSYGFRLWNAGFYPEAQQQLTMFVEQYPNHWRATYGRNLLGRVYLDDGKAQEAAPWFLKNYSTNKTDARAPDSLLYLGEAMIALNDTSRACIALAEFADEYPALASGRLSSQYQANLAKVDCN